MTTAELGLIGKKLLEKHEANSAPNFPMKTILLRHDQPIMPSLNKLTHYSLATG